MSPFPWIILAYVTMPLAFWSVDHWLVDINSALAAGFFFASAIFALILSWRKKKFFILSIIPFLFSVYLVATQVFLRIVV